MRHSAISRRQALQLLLGAGALGLIPCGEALAITQEDIDQTEAELSATQQRYNEVAAQLEEIAVEYEALSTDLSQTLEQIDSVSAQIATTEQQIAEKEADLEEKRDRLSKRVRSAYKSGGDDTLSALLSATTFEELDSNIYYLDKISESDRNLIEDVERLKAELEQHRLDLEGDLAELEGLRAQQTEQLEQMEAKQEQVQEILDGLDEDVRELMAKRDAELLQLAKEREEQRRREEEARKAAESAAKAGTQGAKASNVSGDFQDGKTSGSQKRVIASCQSTPSPGLGLCAMWVSMVFSNAGFAYAGGNANDMYNRWTTSSSRSELKPGMIVAVSTHNNTSAGRIYGHIGIYIGGGMMMDNVGYIRTISVNEWIRYYSTTVTPRWGWLMGIELS